MPRDYRFQIRLSPEERKALEARAAQEERTLSDWARRVLLREARKGGERG